MSKFGKTVIFSADAALIDLADEYAKATKTSRSWVIRSALERLLQELPAPVRNVSAQRLRGEPDATWSGMD